MSGIGRIDEEGGRNRGDVSRGARGRLNGGLVVLTRLWVLVELLAVRVGVSRTLSSCWS